MMKLYIISPDIKGAELRKRREKKGGEQKLVAKNAHIS